MKRLTVKYAGVCRKCGADLPKGADAVWERRVGLFCVACAPADREEIRVYRQEGADRQAERLESWADKRRTKAAELDKRNEPFRGDIAFHTQPGRIIERERYHKRTEKMWEHASKARDMEKHATRLRRGVRVAGDAARRRAKMRERQDKIISKGSKVLDFCFGKGTVIGVYKKSYRIHWDRLGRAFSRDKTFVRLI